MYRPYLMNRVYLNIGCGRAKLEGFVNVDLDPEADLQLDVRQGLPYADDSVHGIYSEHFIEHLSQAEATAFLRECRRVLVPGGLLRVATPDLDRVIEEYATQTWRQPWMEQYGYQWICTRAESLNVQMREWGNQWLFNEEELRRLGEFVGLGLGRRCALNVSQDSMLSRRETRPESSLILEFTKLDESLPENPLVSIVMPAYKAAHFREALQSALAQTYERIEILVLDDSDGEEIEATVRAAQGRPIRYFRNLPRLGEIKSLTRGIELAKGELIKPLHDDDLLEPNCVRKLVEAMFRCPRASLATSRCTLIDVKGRTLLDPSFPLSLPITQVDSEIDGVTLAQAVFQKSMNQIGGPSAVLFRRSHALAIRPTVMCFSGIPTYGWGDVALYLNLMSRGNVVYLTQRLSRYRLHAGQIQRDPQTIAAGHKSWLFLRAHAQRLGLYRPDVTLPLRVRGLGETVWTGSIPLGKGVPHGLGISRRQRILVYDRLLHRTINADFAVIDGQFPQREPFGFRNTEINRYLKLVKNVRVLTMSPTRPGPDAWFTHLYGQDEQTFSDNLVGYLKHYPNNKGRIELINPGNRYRIGLAYSFFLAETYTLLPFYEKNQIPFVFVLYPGGAFGLHNQRSDAMLRKITSSPLFRGVIVTQRPTQRYLIDGNFCPAEKVHYIYGGFAQFDKHEVPPKVSYPSAKKTFDIAFVAAKYSERGVDKGYDLFVDVAKRLAKHENIRFHVIGGFGPDDIDLSEIAPKVTFYGYRPPSFLREFYSKIDIQLSPNRPGKLYEGNFDGFPLGVDASYGGAALFVSDPLFMNEYYSDGDNIVLIPLEADQITKQILNYYNDPEALTELSRRGQSLTQRLFDIDLQVEQRLAVFRQYVPIHLSPCKSLSIRMSLQKVCKQRKELQRAFAT